CLSSGPTANFSLVTSGTVNGNFPDFSPAILGLVKCGRPSFTPILTLTTSTSTYTWTTSLISLLAPRNRIPGTPTYTVALSMTTNLSRYLIRIDTSIDLTARRPLRSWAATCFRTNWFVD